MCNNQRLALEERVAALLFAALYLLIKVQDLGKRNIERREGKRPPPPKKKRQEIYEIGVRCGSCFEDALC